MHSLDSKGKKWVRWSGKVTTPSAKCHVKEENVYSQCRKAANSGPSEKIPPYTHVECTLFLPCVIPSLGPQQTASHWGILTEGMCVPARAFNSTF